MAVDGDVGAREAAAVDDRRVVQLVGADEHAAAAERREHAEVRREPGGEEHRALGALPLRELALELAVDGRDPTMRRAEPRSGAPAVERGVRGRDHRGVLR